jgi:hypothetical protein
MEKIILLLKEATSVERKKGVEAIIIVLHLTIFLI